VSGGRTIQAALTIGELIGAGLVDRLEIITPNPERVVHELVADGATAVERVVSHERVLADKSIVRYREGRVAIGGVPVVVKTSMRPLDCRSPEVP
jgi:hypothetical protein